MQQKNKILNGTLVILSLYIFNCGNALLDAIPNGEPKKNQLPVVIDSVTLPNSFAPGEILNVEATFKKNKSKKQNVHWWLSPNHDHNSIDDVEFASAQQLTKKSGKFSGTIKAPAFSASGSYYLVLRANGKVVYLSQKQVALNVHDFSFDVEEAVPTKSNIRQYQSLDIGLTVTAKGRPFFRQAEHQTQLHIYVDINADGIPQSGELIRSNVITGDFDLKHATDISLRVAIPGISPGNYRLLITDGANYNVLATTPPITIVSNPDPIDIDVEPVLINSKQLQLYSATELELTVNNNSLSEIGPTQIDFYLAEAPNDNSSWIPLQSTIGHYTPSLEANTSARFTINPKFSASISSIQPNRNYHLVTEIDGRNTIIETDKANNNSTTSKTLKVKSDLDFAPTVFSFEYDNNNRSLNISTSIHNQEEGFAHINLTPIFKLYLSRDRRYSGSDTLIASGTSISGLWITPFDPIIHQDEFHFPVLPKGKFYLIYEFNSNDFGTRYWETDRSNNRIVSKQPITIQ